MGTHKFQNKYRIASARHPHWDYRWQAVYFVTLCTQQRIHYFGKIEKGIMVLNDLGQIGASHWFDIPNHFPFVELLNVAIMPNHVHGLIYIRENNAVETVRGGIVETLRGGIVETLHATSLPTKPPQPPPPQSPQKNEKMAKISPKRGSLSSVMRSYKSAVSKYAHELKMEFEWQALFHDHIVRDDDEYQRIFDYITNNPRNWDNDKFNSQKS